MPHWRFGWPQRVTVQSMQARSAFHRPQPKTIRHVAAKQVADQLRNLTRSRMPVFQYCTISTEGIRRRLIETDWSRGIGRLDPAV